MNYRFIEQAEWSVQMVAVMDNETDILARRCFLLQLMVIIKQGAKYNAMFDFFIAPAYHGLFALPNKGLRTLDAVDKPWHVG